MVRKTSRHPNEKKKLLIGDGGNISASNKIRLLLSQLKVNNEIPGAFTDLQSYANANNVVDGVEAFVRNSIEH